jgi:hypothetical protein
MQSILPKALRKVVAALLVVSTAGCTSIGPKTVARDRIDYLRSIGDSWKEQTLLNIVKLRYGDVPVFLEVSQVIAGYQIQGTLGANFTGGNSTAGIVGDFTASGTAAGGGSYTDRPTVIYAPLTGVDFLKNLMTPLPPSAVLFVLQSGYSAELILGIALDSINGVHNASRRAGRTTADPQFTRLVALLRQAQLAQAIQIRVESPKLGAPANMITFPPTQDPEISAEGREIRKILGLDPKAREFRVYYGGWAQKSDEIDMMTRSMLQIMLELAVSVRVPAQDVATGRAAPGRVDTEPLKPAAGPRLEILSGKSAPSDAYVAARYGERWFWIADTDIQSKLAFGFVMLLFSISETGVKGAAPVVTVPASP